jgi:hypothetical protein
MEMSGPPRSAAIAHTPLKINLTDHSFTALDFEARIRPAASTSDVRTSSSVICSIANDQSMESPSKAFNVPSGLRADTTAITYFVREGNSTVERCEEVRCDVDLLPLALHFICRARQGVGTDAFAPLNRAYPSSGRSR